MSWAQATSGDDHRPLGGGTNAGRELERQRDSGPDVVRRAFGDQDRMRYHQPTVDYVARRTADGRTKREIIRCLKRFLAREIYQRVMTDFRARQEIIQAA